MHWSFLYVVPYLFAQSSFDSIILYIAHLLVLSRFQKVRIAYLNPWNKTSFCEILAIYQKTSWPWNEHCFCVSCVSASVILKVVCSFMDWIQKLKEPWEVLAIARKVKFPIDDFFSKCEQMGSFLRIWSHLLKKSSMENFIFCAVLIAVCVCVCLLSPVPTINKLTRLPWV